MTERKQVSEAVIKRLPRYYRLITGLLSGGVEKVSSRALGEMLGITASQVRQDFCSFGEFGQQGYGYTVSTLKDELASIMGLDRAYSLIVLGGGNIGKALSSYRGFKKEGFVIKAVFDVEPSKVRLENTDIEIRHTDELGTYLKTSPVDIAVIATPPHAASEMVRLVSDLGIKSIWNFASADLDGVPADVTVETVNLLESLYMLSYRMNNKQGV